MSEKKIARRKSKSTKKKVDTESDEDIPERIIKLLKDE